ncbi:hypothetical protein BH23BAC4_BH23BAC4_02540 [soil metagenome]
MTPSHRSPAARIALSLAATVVFALGMVGCAPAVVDGFAPTSALDTLHVRHGSGTTGMLFPRDLTRERFGPGNVTLGGRAGAYDPFGPPESLPEATTPMVHVVVYDVAAEAEAIRQRNLSDLIEGLGPLTGDALRDVAVYTLGPLCVDEPDTEITCVNPQVVRDEHNHAGMRFIELHFQSATPAFARVEGRSDGDSVPVGPFYALDAGGGMGIFFRPVRIRSGSEFRPELEREIIRSLVESAQRLP